MKINNILISAGPTQEAIDPVRFITNHSSGKMGYALAQAAVRKGLSVTLVSGPVAIQPPDGLQMFVPVVSAADMAESVKRFFPDMDAVIMCAAVADYRPKSVCDIKMKKQKGTLFLELERTEDILLTLGKRKRENQILVGFAAETNDLVNYAVEKIQKKNLDWIAANQVGKSGCGFQSDTNEIFLFHKSGKEYHFPSESKNTLADKLLSKIFSEEQIN